METNKKTDWQWFLVINSWCLHLSLRAHINYIVAVWTFKRSDVINLFRVTMGSTDHKDFTPVALPFCGHICRIHSAGASGCLGVLPEGRRALDRSASASYSWGAALIFSSLRFEAENSVSQQVKVWMSHADPCPAWAPFSETLVQLQRWLLQPALPRPQ